MKKPGPREKKPGFRALGGTRTPNLLIRSQMLYPLSYKRRVKFDSSLLENQASRGALPKPQVSDKRVVVTNESLRCVEALSLAER